jgi:hypothetical protein
MEAHPARTFGDEGAEATAGVMLIACRLAGLSALEAHYAGLVANAQTGRDFTELPPFTVVFGTGGTMRLGPHRVWNPSLVR